MTNPQPTSKNITVSIVSHGQQTLILPLLEQLQQLCATEIEKVVLTVNTPEPDLITGRDWMIPIETVINAKPQGFGANHNAAFARCTTPWFLVLNPDVRLQANVLTPLLVSATGLSGLMGTRVREPGKVIPEPHRDMLTPSEILRRHKANYQPPNHPVWIPGLFMLFRSEAYQQIKGFDPRFFMYGEDFDICARLQLAGWLITVREDLEVLHEAQRASHRSKKHWYWHVSSLAKVWTSSAFWCLRDLQRRKNRLE